VPPIRRQAHLLAALLLLNSCAEPNDDKDSVITPGEDMPVDMTNVNDMTDEAEMTAQPDLAEDLAHLPPCPTPLTITPATLSAIPLQLLELRPSGGLGDYRFALTQNNSGAILNPITGAYLAGQTRGVTDTITLTDNLCAGQASATVEVVAPIAVAPDAVEIARQGSFTFEVMAGSGQYSFAFIQNRSGGTLTPQGVYTAGDQLGEDIVEIKDALTMETARATIKVVQNATFTADPPIVFIPIGQSMQLRTRGGSGLVEPVMSGDIFTLTHNTLRVSAPGTRTIALKDRFTKQEATLTLHAVSPVDRPTRPTGEAYGISRALSGDLDGDGRPEAILAVPESHAGGYRAGAVLIYKGKADGSFDAAPSRIITGVSREEELGHDIALADLDKDGHLDLILGIRRSNAGAVFSGAVQIYRGARGKLLEDGPSITWSGAFGGDEFGYTVSACDFNKDGRLDVAVGAPLAEDRDAQPVRSNQGMVAIFLNYPSGFIDRPDIRIWGKTPANGMWQNAADMRLGSSLATGDFDGDGYCDVASGNDLWNGNEGAAFVYRGFGPDMLGPGGVQSDPALAISHQDPDRADARFGRRLALVDLNNDGKAELAVGAFNDRVPGKTAVGSVLVFQGKTLNAIAQDFIATTAADWSFFGNDATDNVGWEVSAADVSGDGKPDLIVGAANDEPAGAMTANVGALHIFYATAGAALPAQPDASLYGEQGGEYFGQSAAALGDVDGDGKIDLFVHSPRHNRLGYLVGGGQLVWGDAMKARAALDVPAVASGGRFGAGIALVPDISGDGKPDLVVGAPYTEPEGLDQLSAGVVYLYASQGDGFAAQPTQTLKQFTGHSNSDLLGWSVSTAGDFDGDGLHDLAVVAALEDQPNTWSSAYDAGGCAPGTRNDAGAVYIFRGKMGGLVEDQPSFIVFGPQSSGQVRQVIGGLDINGDGLGDLVFSSPLWDLSGTNDVGGFSVIHGRAYAGAGKVQVLCDATGPHLDGRSGAQLGYSLAPLGKIDGDMCDDFAVGAPAHSQGAGSQGQVRVVFGWGPGCAQQAPRQVAIASGTASARLGSSIDGGHDLDGDGKPDLVVGGEGYIVRGNSVGAAWVVPGFYLAGLPKEPVGTNSEPATLQPMAPADKLAQWRIEGKAAGGLFGGAVALIPNGAGNMRAAFAVGSTLGDIAGVTQSGGAQVFQFERMAGRINPNPLAAFAGEPTRPGARLGEYLAGGSAGDKAVLVVGGYRSSANAPDDGAAFPLIWTP
jgi:hypothetical protein